jgi:predicted acetyltransferase
MRDALADFLDDFRARGESHPPYDFSEENGFPGVEGYIEFWSLMSVRPPSSDLVVTDTFVLTVGERAVGEVRIRHHLTPRLVVHGGHIGYGVPPSDRNRGYGTLLLGLGLDRAREIGLANALLTIDVTNAPSLAVAAKYGAVPSDEVRIETGALHRRFWLPTAPSPR